MSCKDQYQIEVQPAEAGGVNSTAISSPHIIQYPKQPKRDDGKWMALGNIIGALIGKFANAGKLSDASKAEDNWADLNKQLHDQGNSEWNRVPVERQLATTADDDLRDLAEKDKIRSDTEYGFGESLKPCIETLTAEVCEFARCGYVPDYQGILNRAKADAEIVAASKLAEACRAASRYNVGMSSMVASDIRRAAQLSIVGTAAQLREQERATKWKVDSEIKMKALELTESMRNRRQETSNTISNRHLTNQTQRYTAHNQNGYASLQMGGDLLSSAGQNYAWLAESLRRSAEKDSGNFAALGALIASLFLPQFFSGCGYESKDCSCETGSGGGGATP